MDERIDPEQLPTVEEAAALPGRILVDDNGERIGEIEDVYVDRDTGRGEWALVHTGWLGARLHFVPLLGLVNLPDFVQVGYTVEQVKEAPDVAHDGELDDGEERRLYDHYGFPFSDAGGTGTPGLPSTSRRVGTED